MLQVIDYMERIARNNSAIVTLVNAGNSFEGRPVKYLKVSSFSFRRTIVRSSLGNWFFKTESFRYQPQTLLTPVNLSTSWRQRCMLVSG